MERRIFSLYLILHLVERDRFRIGVPFKTKYKLVLGDNEADQKKTLTAVKGDCDGYPQSLLIDLHKYGIAVYELTVMFLRFRLRRYRRII